MTVLTGLTIEDMLGTEIHVTDPLREKLLENKSRGTAYRKEELAKLVGITPHQLDSLAKKYHITPFWKQCGGNRTESIRITLTASEKQRVSEAAALHGNGQMAVFVGTVLLRETDRILKGNENNNEEESQADAVQELLIMDSLRFELSFEEMAEEICACIGWEPALYPPYRDAASLDRLGRQVADHMSALHPPEGAEAYLLLLILSSDEMAEKVM